MEEEEDLPDFDKVKDIIEELTTTGTNELDVTHTKSLNKLCKDSNDVLETAYHTLMDQLRADHAQIRYSTFQIIIELFSRSHSFRKLIADNLHNIFPLTVETDPINYPLPLPTKDGKKLKLLALRTINDWYKKYGDYYRRISLGYEFLRDVKKVKFSTIDAVLNEERRKEKEKKEKAARILKSKLDQVDMQIYDSYDNIMGNIKEMENCFQLFLPKVEGTNDNITDSNEHKQIEDISVIKNYQNSQNESGLQNSKNLENESVLQNSKNLENKSVLQNSVDYKNEGETNEFNFDIGTETGIHGRNYNVTIEIPNKLEIVEDENNTDLINRMSELYKELHTQPNVVKRWLRILIKCSSPDNEKMKTVLDLKNMLSSASSKYLEINIVRLPGNRDSDEDFVDVPEKIPGDKPKIKEKMLKPVVTAITESVTHKPDLPSDSTEISEKEKLLKIAPVIPYDTDLMYWGKDVKPQPSMKIDSLHRFWKTNEHVEEFVPPDVAESLRTRVMLFPGKFEPVNHKCGVRLPNGTLCERMDRYKCPFHGNIVERDEKGMPKDQEKFQEELKRKHEEEQLRMESIQKEIEVSMVTKFIRKKPKKAKVETPEDRSKSRYSRLTNIKKEQSSTNKRLEKKVFSRDAVKKVYANMDAMMTKKSLAKFANNFNYH